MTVWFARYGATKFGGAENYLRRVVSAIEDKGEDVGVFSTDVYGYKTVLLPKKEHMPSWLYIKKLSNLISSARVNYPGILFSLERVPCADIYRAGDGVHKVWLDIKTANQSSLRTRLDALNPLHKTYLDLEKQTFENSKIIIANSKRGADEIVYSYGISRDKIKVIYNGALHPQIPIDKAKAKANLAKEIDLSTDIPLILFVGSGFFRKGVKAFLEILSFIRQPFNAIVLGKDKKIKKYESLATSLGLANKVRFLGARSDTEMFYSAADIFLFPTLYEPFSNACLEAMGYGCVLFTTPQNGVAEILNDNSTIIYENSTTAAIIGALLADKSALGRLQDAHRKIALEYDVKRNVNATLDVIKELS